MNKRKLNDGTATWIPGMAGPQDPLIEQALKRFHLHTAKQRAELARIEIEAAKLENNRLILQLKLARTSLWFYAAGNNDGGTSAKSALGGITRAISACRS